MPSSNTADLDPVPQNSPPFPTSADHTGNPPTPRETPAPPDQPIPDPADALTDRQRPALDLMLLGATDTRIAQELSIDRKTLYNWKTHDPAFRAALTHHRAILHNQATDRFRALLSAALDALDKQVHDRYTPNAFRAARALLSLAQIGRHAAPQQPPQADPLSLLKPRK